MTTGKAIALTVQAFGDWNAKVGSEEVPDNRQVWLWSTK